MMPDEEAFCRTINNSPHDDGPRLVFADWLEETGECDKAELLRLACERSRLARAGAKPKKLHELAKREDQIRAANPYWPTELPALPQVEWGPVERGFVSTIRVRDAAAFLRGAKEIFTAAPIMCVWFDVLDDEGTLALAESRWLARLALLKAHGTPISDRALKALVDSPHMVNLTRLFLTASGLGDASARAIARSRRLGKLTTLFLNSNQIGSDGALALANSKRLPSLQEIYLAGNEMGRAGIAAVRQRWGDHAHI